MDLDTASHSFVAASLKSKIHAPLPVTSVAQIILTRLLIVDDDALVRKFHRRFLAPSFSELIEAVNGEEALEAVKLSIEQGYTIDGIIMDSSMPVMDGTIATMRIRQLGYKGKIFGHSIRTA